MPRHGDDGVGAVQEIGDGCKVRRRNPHGTSGAEGLQHVVYDAHEAVEADQNVFVQDVVYCAPTVAVTDVWQASMRHIAHEGRCFLVCAVQYQPTPEALGIEVPHWDPKAELMRGGSVIIDPQGNVLAGPFYHEEGLLTAEIETDEILRARYDLDVSGHYARPDIFKLTVDARRKPNVEVIHD